MNPIQNISNSIRRFRIQLKPTLPNLYTSFIFWYIYEVCLFLNETSVYD